MRLNDYFRIAKRWLPIALVLALLAGAGSYVYTKYEIRPLYTATSVMQVQIGQPSQANPVDPQYDSAGALTDATVAAQPPNIKAALAMVKGALHPTLSAGEKKVLTQNLVCQSSGTTSLFSCSATSHDPVLAAAMVNAVARVFIKGQQSWDQSLYKALLDRIESDEHAAKRAHDRNRYDNLVQVENNTRMAELQRSNIVRVVSPAVAPLTPSSPHRSLNAALAFLLVFLIVGVGGVAIDQMDSTIRRSEDLSRVTDLPILSAIPDTREFPRKRPSDRSLILAHHPSSPVAEAFRLARADIAFTTLDKHPRTLLVTSAMEGEGKSTVASNLASAFAESGKSTILVDLDLRRPSVASIFHPDVQPGLTSLLLDESATTEDYLLPTEQPRLRVIVSGPLPPNPGPIISSHRMGQVLRELQDHADIVVIDSPPVLPLADSAILSGLCDAAVLVVRLGSTTRRTVARTIEVLGPSGINIAGCIVNCVNRGNDSYYRSDNYQPYGYETRKGEPTPPVPARPDWQAELAPISVGDAGHTNGNGVAHANGNGAHHGSDNGKESHGSPRTPVSEGTAEWSLLCRELEKSVGALAIEGWFAPLRPLSCADGVLTVETPSDYHRQWIEYRWGAQSGDVLKRQTNGRLTLRYVAPETNGTRLRGAAVRMMRVASAMATEDGMTKDNQPDNEVAPSTHSAPFPTGDEIAGPGTVREGSGYSGTTSGGVEVGTGHDPDPYDPPDAGYMGDTTSSDEPPVEEVIVTSPEANG
ncbi:MAG: polysaccharide biosynthesis tyrosine autokinase [Chloroflexota bacterium]